jgi:hypothetical protein
MKTMPSMLSPFVRSDAVGAILAVQGIRAEGGDGAHAVLLDAVRLQFPGHHKELQRFDWMRTVRNNTEYPDFDTPVATA